MPANRLWLSPDWSHPTYWLDPANQIPDDGADYVVTFENGVYKMPAGLYRWYAQRKRQEGSLVLRAQSPGEVVFEFDDTTTGLARFMLSCPSVHLDGFVFRNTSAIGPTQNRMEWYIGDFKKEVDAQGWSNYYYWQQAVTSRFIMTNCRVEGAQITFYVTLSFSPVFQTECHIRDLDLVSVSGTTLLLTSEEGAGNVASLDADWGANVDLLMDRINVSALYGPDDTSWEGGVADSSHKGYIADPNLNTGAVIDIHGLDHTSSVEINRLIATATVEGSHSPGGPTILQFSNPQSAGVRATIRDSNFIVDWTEGHFDSFGAQTRTITPVRFDMTDTSAPSFPTEGSRPRFDFENCLFKGYVRSAVPNDEAPYPFRELVRTDHELDIHFWDCEFNWQVENANYGTDLRAMRTYSQDVTGEFHNCEFVNIGTPHLANPDVLSGVVERNDSESRGFSDKRWHRVLRHAKAYTPLVTPSTLISNPSFEDGPIGGPDDWVLSSPHTSIITQFSGPPTPPPTYTEGYIPPPPDGGNRFLQIRIQPAISQAGDAIQNGVVLDGVTTSDIFTFRFQVCTTADILGESIRSRCNVRYRIDGGVWVNIGSLPLQPLNLHHGDDLDTWYWQSFTGRFSPWTNGTTMDVQIKGDLSSHLPGDSETAFWFFDLVELYRKGG